MSSSPFNAKSTATEVLANVNIANKTYLVTGGTNGIGTETVRALAAKGATVYFTARDAKKGESTLQQIRSSTGNKNVYVIQMNLESFDSVRKGAKQFLEKNIPLHALLLNAGIMAVPYKIIEGHESQFTVDHLSHFLLAVSLVPALKAAYTATGVASRITVLASGGHWWGDINYDDITWSKKYDKWQAYGQAKTANVVFAKEFNRRYAKQGIIANAVHPGVIHTGLQFSVTPADWRELGIPVDDQGNFPAYITFKSIEAGAATTVWVTTAKETSSGGYYCEDCNISGVGSKPLQGYAPYTDSEESGKKLWSLSEKATGITAA